MITQRKVTILSLPFDNMTKNEFLNEFITRIKQKKKTSIVTANPEIVMYAKEHPNYMRILKNNDYVVPDGIGIIKGAALLKTPIVERVPGIELMLELLKAAESNNFSVYFIGATQEVIEKLVEQIHHQYPSLSISGYQNGYFDSKEESVIDQVIEKKPDIVFAALGYPKQEKWIEHYMNKAEEGLVMGVGGSFDVLSGTTKRAPDFFLTHNIEWLYRLLKQPSRIGRMMALPKFLFEVYKQKHY